MSKRGENPEVLTPDQASEIFGVHPSVLASALSDGTLVPGGTDALGRPLLTRDDVVSLIRSNPKAEIHASLSGRPEMGPEATDRQRLLAEIPYLARRLAEADYSALTLMNERGRISRMFVSGMTQEQANAIGEPPVGRGVLGHMGPGGTTLRLHDIVSDIRSVGLPEGHPPMTSMIGVGIEQRQSHTANLYVTRSPRRQAFSAEDQMIVESLAGFTKMALDAERMRRAEAELRQKADELESAKSDFLSMVSHDLRNPISGIAMSIESLRSQVEEGLQVEILSMSDSLAVIDGLVSSLLDMSRLQSGTVPMEKEQCYLTDIVNDAVTRIRRLSIATGRTLAVDVPADLPSIFGDPTYLVRVVENILTNALKYSNSDVRITGTMADLDIRCEISDDGNGIPPEEREHIFELFYRLDGSDGRTGVGLGLAICKSIVDNHSGSVGVTENNSGGATFWFSIPIDDADINSPGSMA